MSEITTLLWDVGGVMLSNGWDLDSRKAACERFGIEEQEFEKRHAQVDEAFEAGRLTLDGYLDSTIFYQPRSFTREEFTAFIFSQSSANAGTLALLRELAGTRRYLMVTLNNEGAELNRYRVRTFQLTRYFSAFLSSCYLGVRKPDESIYRLAVEIVQRPAERSYLSMIVRPTLNLRGAWACIRFIFRIRSNCGRTLRGAACIFE